MKTLEFEILGNVKVLIKKPPINHIIITLTKDEYENYIKWKSNLLNN